MWVAGFVAILAGVMVGFVAGQAAPPRWRVLVAGVVSAGVAVAVRVGLWWWT